MSDVGNAARAGLVIVAGAIIAVGFFFASKKSQLDSANSSAHYALLTDASGITAKSLITVAGLQVGEIKSIELVGVAAQELIPDLEVRALAAMGFPPESIELRIPVNEDFDRIITSMIEQGKLLGPAEAKARAMSREQARALVTQVSDDVIRVARMDFSITSTVPVPEDSWMKKESLGLLGAKALFLELGPSTRMLKDGERVVNVRSITGTDALLARAEGIVGDVRNITNKIDKDLGAITGDIKGITGEIHRFVAGDGKTMPLDELYRLVMTDLRKLSNTVEVAVRDADKLLRGNDAEIGKLIANVQRITGDVADLLAAGDAGAGTGTDGGGRKPGDLRATMASVRQVADDLSGVTRQLRTMLSTADEAEMGEGVQSLKTTIGELNRSLTSLADVAGKVERGEGAVGKLLTDEVVAQKVEQAVSGASDFVTSLTSIEAHVDIGSWYNVNREASTTTLGLRLQPKADKYYLVEIVDDGGRLERVTERDRDGNVWRESIREEDNQLRFSAMFAKQFFDFLVLRVGLIETSGGLGATMTFLERRIELRTDLFGFRGPRDSLAADGVPVDVYLPRWRTLVKAQPIPHLYVSAGVDDVLNGLAGIPTGGIRTYSDALGLGFDYFFGVGLTFKDEDLRSILPFIPGG